MLDDAAIRAFLRDDYGRLVNAVRLASGSSAAAEDAVQEALARAWHRSSRGEEVESLPGWVLAVALNLSRSTWRRSRAERRATERLAAVIASPVTSETLAADLERALAALPRRQREIAVLRYLLEMSTNETAEALGISAGTVKSSLSRARQSLSASLDLREEERDVEA